MHPAVVSVLLLRKHIPPPLQLQSFRDISNALTATAPPFYVLAHSMGTYVVQECCVLDNWPDVVPQHIVFIGADVPASSMVDGDPVWTDVAKRCVHFTNYFNTGDEVLLVSQLLPERVLFHGQERLGRVGLQTIQSEKQSNVDCTEVAKSVPTIDVSHTFYLHSPGYDTFDDDFVALLKQPHNELSPTDFPLREIGVRIGDFILKKSQSLPPGAHHLVTGAETHAIPTLKEVQTKAAELHNARITDSKEIRVVWKKDRFAPQSIFSEATVTVGTGSALCSTST